jgi:CRISPR system Cascade subunit CasC
MFIEIHIIQNFAPSNLNRDDTNTPKDCEFGGIRRARISSQCIKRAIRWNPIFAKITQVQISDRTKNIVKALCKRLEDLGMGHDEAEKRAIEFAKNYSSKKGEMDKKNKTVVSLFMAKKELDHIADLLSKNKDMDEIKNIAVDFAKQTKMRPSAPDIALFGRMLADYPSTNVDAACQVAHAFSTHRVNMDLDFFTAVDDLQDPNEGEAGADMMGVTGFNSACFYRYACLDWDQLLTNLDGDRDLAQRTVEGFLRASVISIPDGKQNSFAAQNQPDFILAIVRADGMSWSLANAFEKPVAPTREAGLISKSVEALDTYWEHLLTIYGNSSIKPFVLLLDPNIKLKSLSEAQIKNFEGLIQAVKSSLPRA